MSINRSQKSFPQSHTQKNIMLKNLFFPYFLPYLIGNDLNEDKNLQTMPQRRGGLSPLASFRDQYLSSTSSAAFPTSVRVSFFWGEWKHCRLFFVLSRMSTSGIRFALPSFLLLPRTWRCKTPSNILFSCPIFLSLIPTHSSPQKRISAHDITRLHYKIA